MNEQETTKLFLNPFYVIKFAPWLASDHEPMASKEDWIKVNAQLIDELGKEEWLRQLLEILEKSSPPPNPNKK
jgi:hypothetical protein